MSRFVVILSVISATRPRQLPKVELPFMLIGIVCYFKFLIILSQIVLLLLELPLLGKTISLLFLTILTRMQQPRFMGHLLLLMVRACNLDNIQNYLQTTRLSIQENCQEVLSQWLNSKVEDTSMIFSLQWWMIQVMW